MESLELKDILNIPKLTEIAYKLAELHCTGEWFTVEIKLPNKELLRKFNEDIFFRYGDMIGATDIEEIPDEITLNIANIHFKFIYEEEEVNYDGDL